MAINLNTKRVAGKKREADTDVLFPALMEFAAGIFYYYPIFMLDALGVNNDASQRLAIALVQGLLYGVVTATFGMYRAGYINFTYTCAAVVTRQVGWKKGIGLFAAQFSSAYLAWALTLPSDLTQRQYGIPYPPQPVNYLSVFSYEVQATSILTVVLLFLNYPHLDGQVASDNKSVRPKNDESIYRMVLDKDGMLFVGFQGFVRGSVYFALVYPGLWVSGGVLNMYRWLPPATGAQNFIYAETYAGGAFLAAAIGSIVYYLVTFVAVYLPKAEVAWKEIGNCDFNDDDNMYTK